MDKTITPAINPALKNGHLAMKAKGLSDSAQKWAKDLFEVMVGRENMTPEEALKNLARSPFFKREWIES